MPKVKAALRAIYLLALKGTAPKEGQAVPALYLAHAPERDCRELAPPVPPAAKNFLEKGEIMEKGEIRCQTTFSDHFLVHFITKIHGRGLIYQTRFPFDAPRFFDDYFGFVK